MKYIIWDWNGTLFDDVEACIKSMNSVLKKIKLPQINDKSVYRSIFTFPVKKYYENLGFDFSINKFELLAIEFMKNYQPLSMDCNLTKESKKVLKLVKEKGYKQMILSASKTENLLQQVELFDINDNFEHILGVDNIYANTKLDIANKWMKVNNISNEEIIVIGDTLHDFEIAKALKAKCILYTNGHQKIIDTNKKQYYTVDKLTSIFDYI